MYLAHCCCGSVPVERVTAIPIKRFVQFKTRSIDCGGRFISLAGCTRLTRLPSRRRLYICVEPYPLQLPELKLLCRWKKQQGDKPLPTRKDALIARFKATKDRTSPTVSPSNSDDESESDEDGDSVDAYDSDATAPTDDDVEFGDEVESSDEEDEESDEEGSSESEEEESDEEGS